MKKVLTIAAVVLMSAGIASAQRSAAPSEKLGFGATLAIPTSEVAMSGAQGQYALNENLHIGAGIGLEIADAGTFFSLTPYAKYLMSPMGGVRPYVIGQLAVQRISAKNFAGNTESTTNTSILAGVGAEYFITDSFGVFATIPALILPFRSGGAVSFGVLSPTIGIEMFLD
ncbi:MAG: porin family protein [Candidatus Kapabacteria bacterium]|nr:porin family protein [Candidatus Kapabacteria bacterium]